MQALKEKLESVALAYYHDNRKSVHNYMAGQTIKVRMGLNPRAQTLRAGMSRRSSGGRRLADGCAAATLDHLVSAGGRTGGRRRAMQGGHGCGGGRLARWELLGERWAAVLQTVERRARHLVP